MIQHRKHHTSKVHYCSAALGLSVSFYPEAFGCQLTRTARRASQVTSLRLNSGAIGSNFEFENSTIWYSTQTASELEGVVTAAESARDAASDVRFAYGPSANPNGTSAVSSKVGMISEILFRVQVSRVASTLARPPPAPRPPGCQPRRAHRRRH